MQRLHGLKTAVTPKQSFLDTAMQCLTLTPHRLAILATHPILVYPGLDETTVLALRESFCQLLTAPGHSKPQKASSARHMTVHQVLGIPPQLTGDGTPVQKH